MGCMLVLSLMLSSTNILYSLPISKEERVLPPLRLYYSREISRNYERIVKNVGFEHHPNSYKNWQFLYSQHQLRRHAEIKVPAIEGEWYSSNHHEADALFNTVDALLTETQAHSFPELSLSPLFERRWCSLYEAFEDGQIDQNRLRQVFAKYLLQPVEGKQMWLGIDATSIERPQSKTSPDRTVVYKPNLEDEQQAHQLWLAVLDGRTSARAAQQLDGGTRSAAHPLGPNERGGGSSPTASACSAAWLSSDRGQRSLVQFCAGSRGHRGTAVRQIAAPQTQAGVVPCGFRAKMGSAFNVETPARMGRPMAVGRAAMSTDIPSRSAGGMACICPRHGTSK